MERLVKIVNSFQPFTIFTKSSILVVWLDFINTSLFPSLCSLRLRGLNFFWQDNCVVNGEVFIHTNNVASFIFVNCRIAVESGKKWCMMFIYFVSLMPKKMVNITIFIVGKLYCDVLQEAPPLIWWETSLGGKQQRKCNRTSSQKFKIFVAKYNTREKYIPTS